MEIRIAIKSGSTESKIAVLMQSTVEYLSKSVNIPYHIYEIDDIEKVLPGNPLKYHVPIDIILYPLEHMIDCTDYDSFELSSIFDYTETVIISSPTKRAIKGGIGNLLPCDLFVFLSIFGSLFVISVSFAFAHWLFSKQKLNGISNFPGFASSIFSSVWNLAAPLFQEAIPSIPPFMSLRLVSLSWLMSAVVIVIFVSCEMKAVFSTIEYLTIDSIEDFKYYPEMQPKILKDGYPHRYFKKVAKWNPKMRKLYERFNEPGGWLDFIDLMDFTLYESIRDGTSCIFMNKRIFKILAQLSIGTLEKSPLKFYYSKKSLKVAPLSFGLNRSLPENVTEIFNRRILDVFEKQPFQYIYRSMDTFMEKHQWNPSTSVDFAMTMTDFFSVMIIWGIGLGLSYVVLIMENLFFAFVGKY